MSQDGQGVTLPGPLGAPGLRSVVSAWFPEARQVDVDDHNGPKLDMDLRGFPEQTWYIKNTGADEITYLAIGWWINDLEWLDVIAGAVPIPPGGVVILDYRRSAVSGRLYLGAVAGSPTTADVGCVASGI